MSRLFKNENLYICGAQELLELNGLTHVLNCAEELDRRCDTPYYVKIPMTDDEDILAIDQIHKGAALLNTWTQDPNAVIAVHCKAGVSRSVTVVLAFLILYRGMSLNDAYTFVQKQRPYMQPNRFYMECLKQIEKSIKTKKD